MLYVPLIDALDLSGSEWAECVCSLIKRFIGPTWGPPGADRTQVGPMLSPWSLLSGLYIFELLQRDNTTLIHKHCIFTLTHFFLVLVKFTGSILEAVSLTNAFSDNKAMNIITFILQHRCNLFNFYPQYVSVVVVGALKIIWSCFIAHSYHNTGPLLTTMLCSDWVNCLITVLSFSVGDLLCGIWLKFAIKLTDFNYHSEGVVGH